MDTIALVRAFIAKECDYDGALSLDDDVFYRLGITGDDSDDFLESFAKTFDIDTSGYLWYFHSEEEGFSVVPFKPPNQLVDRIPITIQVLAESVEAKVWTVVYPDHDMPASRLDVAFHWFFFVVLISLVIYLVL